MAATSVVPSVSGPFVYDSDRDFLIGSYWLALVWSFAAWRYRRWMFFSQSPLCWDLGPQLEVPFAEDGLPAVELEALCESDTHSHKSDVPPTGVFFSASPQCLRL